jgi:hypothetical protein
VEEAAEATGGAIRQTMWSSYYDADLNPVPDQTNAYYEITTIPENSGVEGLGRADVKVFRYDGNEALFFVTVAWQEVADNG